MIEKPRKKKKNKKLSQTQILIRMIIFIAVVGTILRIFIVSPYRIKDKAMQNSLYAGDFLLASKLTYRNSTPQVGDMILFEHPFRLGEKLVRRVVATEGQSVEIVSKTVYVDGRPFQDFSMASHCDQRILPSDYSSRDYMRRQLVPPGELFVMGDNRDSSEDSRDFGFVSASKVEGKGLIVYFSWAPDPDAPKMEPPYIFPAIHLLFYNLYNFPSRVRWDRLFI